jgi:hypothetical protein
MIQVVSIEESKSLCEKAKHFFLAKNFSECVIEISDRPFDEWTVHFTPTSDLMALKRCELSRAKKFFLAIYCNDTGEKRFFFYDKNIIQLEIAETGEIIKFHDNTVEHFNRKLLIKEIGLLKKMLQGA